MAKKGGASKDAISARRSAQLEQIAAVVQDSSAKLDRYRKGRDQCRVLQSVAAGLYEEVDKVSKKAPAEEVTKLVYDEVNHLISEVKGLAQSDPYVQRLKQFVAAGELPPNRDVVVVLKLVLQGLERFSDNLRQVEPQERERFKEVVAVRSALTFYLEYKETPTSDELRDMGTPAPNDWLYDDNFDFNRLDSMDISVYFARGGVQA